jgi:hypothetical protein
MLPGPTVRYIRGVIVWTIQFKDGKTALINGEMWDDLIRAASMKYDFGFTRFKELLRGCRERCR